MKYEYRVIFCTTCCCKVKSRLTKGAEVYPHRRDLFNLHFWKCDTCDNFVGCHRKLEAKYKPLGVIACQEIKNKRMQIHQMLDPIWESGKVSRSGLYNMISGQIGYKYHTANIKSVEEANMILKIINEIKSKYHE